MTAHKDDCIKISEAFKAIHSAASQINEVLERNEGLNESVPKNWPLNLSADEFALECHGMAAYYAELAELQDVSNNVFEYFHNHLGRPPEDETLKRLGVSTPCGMDCRKVILATATLLTVSDPSSHPAMIDAAEDSVGVFWRG